MHLALVISFSLRLMNRTRWGSSVCAIEHTFAFFWIGRSFFRMRVGFFRIEVRFFRIGRCFLGIIVTWVIRLFAWITWCSCVAFFAFMSRVSWWSNWTSRTYRSYWSYRTRCTVFSVTRYSPSKMIIAMHLPNDL